MQEGVHDGALPVVGFLIGVAAVGLLLVAAMNRDGARVEREAQAALSTEPFPFTGADYSDGVLFSGVPDALTTGDLIAGDYTLIRIVTTDGDPSDPLMRLEIMSEVEPDRLFPFLAALDQELRAMSETERQRVVQDVADFATSDDARLDTDWFSLVSSTDRAAGSLRGVRVVAPG